MIASGYLQRVRPVPSSCPRPAFIDVESVLIGRGPLAEGDSCCRRQLNMEDGTVGDHPVVHERDRQTVRDEFAVPNVGAPTKNNVLLLTRSGNSGKNASPDQSNVVVRVDMVPVGCRWSIKATSDLSSDMFRTG